MTKVILYLHSFHYFIYRKLMVSQEKEKKLAILIYLSVFIKRIIFIHIGYFKKQFIRS